MGEFVKQEGGHSNLIHLRKEARALGISARVYRTASEEKLYELVGAAKMKQRVLKQREPHDDLAVIVKVSGRNEPQPFVKPARAAVSRYVADHELGGALGSYEL